MVTTTESGFVNLIILSVFYAPLAAAMLPMMMSIAISCFMPVLFLYHFLYAFRIGFAAHIYQYYLIAAGKMLVEIK